MFPERIKTNPPAEKTKYPASADGVARTSKLNYLFIVSNCLELFVRAAERRACLVAGVLIKLKNKGFFN